MWKYYALRLTYLLLSRLPLSVLYGIAHVVGDAAYLARAGARRAVMANMRRVLGPEASEREVRRTAREVFRNASRYYADLIYVPRMDLQRFARDKLELTGLEYILDAQRAGRGVVITGAHFGNPDMATQGLAASGLRVLVLTEPLQPQALSDFTHWLRSHHGHEYRPADFGGVKAAVRQLKRGGMLCILSDRDVGGTGVPMEFFGAEASIPLGAVDIAMRTGADLIPAWARRLPGYRFEARIGPPVELVRTGDFDADVRANARRLLAVFERELRADPGQWAVLEPIWDDGEPAAPSRTVQ
ncbi:MAG: hypothetical protein IIC88_04900 [Chloroflexi bacterium]|nr:hypothetical protein [Chloroflexota bacterium]